eukprot:607555-Prorocentrum_lima.AAC.1
MFPAMDSDHHPLVAKVRLQLKAVYTPPSRVNCRLHRITVQQREGYNIFATGAFQRHRRGEI